MKYKILDGFDLKVKVLDYNRNLAKNIFDTVKSTWNELDNLRYDVNDEFVRSMIDCVLEKQLNPALLDLSHIQLQVDGMTRVGMSQITRQRSAIFNVKSMCAFEGVDTFRFVRPLNYADHKVEFEEIVKKSVNLYNKLIDEGLPPQDARYILPHCVECGRIVWNTTVQQLANISAFRMCNTASPDENNLVFRKYIFEFTEQLEDDLANKFIDKLTYNVYMKLLENTDALGAKNDTFCTFNSVIKNSDRFTKTAEMSEALKNIAPKLKFQTVDFENTQFIKELQTQKYLLLKGEDRCI